MFTITDLKKHLGPGLGLRKNKYLLEIPVPGVEGNKLNVLVRSAGLPERKISTTTIYHKGRNYNVRGETDFGGEYEVSILDDSSMNIRKTFDKWAKKVDDSSSNSTGAASYESGFGEILDVIKSGVEVANQIKNTIENPLDSIGGFFLGLIDSGSAASIAKYQTDINIWQLSSSGEKIYGYKLQNAFPSSIGIVTLDDGDENTLSEFSVTFTYSEFIPLENSSITKQILDSDIGDTGKEILDGVESLFD
jgi:hypothetical protein